MHNHYTDIRERISETPKWWDEYAVPRYCEFAPEAKADIYADEVALLAIRCQQCGASFRVAMSSSHIARIVRDQSRLSDEIQSGEIHYGDPPNAGCCPAGPTMNCIDVRVIEYWRHKDCVWERDAALEVSLEE